MQSASRRKLQGQLQTNLNSKAIRPLLTLLPRTAGKIRPLGKQHKPHRILRLVELLHMFRQTRLVLFPIPLQEDELSELHSPPNDRNILQRFLENNIDAAMHASSIAYPPQIQPVCIDLVIRHENHSIWKVTDEATIAGLDELTTHRGIAAHSDLGGSPPLGHGHHEEAPRLFGECDPGIVPILI